MKCFIRAEEDVYDKQPFCSVDVIHVEMILRIYGQDGLAVIKAEWSIRVDVSDMKASQ